MQTGRLRRIKRTGHVGQETDAILERGKEIGRKVAQEDYAKALDIQQARFDRTMVDTTNTFERRKVELERSVTSQVNQIKDLQNQLEQLRHAYENREVAVDFNSEETQEGLQKLTDAVASFKQDNFRTSGVPRYYVWKGWPVFEICGDVKLFVSVEVRKFLTDGRLAGFARSVQTLYENALHTGRVAAIVPDPIAYRGRVGVFVKDGDARDAAAAAARIAGP